MLFLEREQALINQTIESVQTQTYTNYIRGLRFLAEEKSEIAIGCFTTSIGLLPILHPIYRLRAIAFIAYKMHAKALSDCDTILSCTLVPHASQQKVIKDV